MKVSLLLPPYFPADSPYLSLPSLAAFLRSHRVSCRDVNVELWDILLSEEFLSSSYPSDVVQKAERAKEILRSEEAFDIFKYMEALTSIEMVWKALSEGFPTSLTWREYVCPASLQEIVPLITHLKKGPLDAFYTPFEEYLLDSLVKGEPDIIGFSIPVSHQLIPSLEMASLLKRELPDVFIVFGGAYMTHLGVFDHIVEHLFSYCDCVSQFEGEKSLQHLIEYREGGIPLEEVPNIVYMDSNVKRTFLSFLDINCVPCPQYDVLPLTRYFAPYLVLPYLTSRGCSWHSCRFCPLHFSYGNGYRQLPVERVITDIKSLKKKYNLNYLSLVDLSLHPEYALNLAEALLEEDIRINIKANMRFEQNMDEQFFETLRKAGFRMLSFGMESYNDRVLEIMNKGTTTELIKKTLKASSDNDIWNHVYFMTGFPTETEEEIMNTQKFITEHPQLMGTIDHMRFELYYPALKNCDLLHVEDVFMKPNVFGLAYQYSPREGVTQERASELDCRIEREIRKCLPDHWIAQTLSHDMLLQYINRYGNNISQAF